MARVFNFSAGPSMLPEEVLKKAAEQMLDYEGSGQSVMEMSHRSKVFDAIIKDTEKLFRELYNIPTDTKKHLDRLCFIESVAPSAFIKSKLRISKKLNCRRNTASFSFCSTGEDGKLSAALGKHTEHNISFFIWSFSQNKPFIYHLQSLHHL